jgi:hypothetical protein
MALKEVPEANGNDSLCRHVQKSGYLQVVSVLHKFRALFSFLLNVGFVLTA